MSGTALKRVRAITSQLTAGLATPASVVSAVSAGGVSGDAKDVKSNSGSLVPAVAPQSTRADHVNQRNGGLQIAKALLEQHVKVVYTLTGGHIAPMLVGCNQVGIRVVDVRDEVTTCFAADATARMTGIPGVAMVTAGPGLTNTITAVKNAQLAESPIVVFGGATAMILKGRGALQDIDQLALMKPHCKLMISIRTVRDIIPSIRRAFRVAQEGVPGPVFLETPIEILWPETLFQEMIGGSMGDKKKEKQPFQFNMASFMAAAQQFYLQRYAANVFRDGLKEVAPLACITVPMQLPNPASITSVHAQLLRAQRPVFVIGSQAVRALGVAALSSAIETLGVPVYLSGMARGLMGRGHRLHMRHKRGVCLAKSDFVVLAGVPMDFRLDYGRGINKAAYLAIVNLSADTLKMNSEMRRANARVLGDAHSFMTSLAQMTPPDKTKLADWIKFLTIQCTKRDDEINAMIVAETKPKTGAAAASKQSFVHPIYLCKEIDNHLADDAVIVGDGGDFVGTAAYVVQPRGPLQWLDPGVFGTLGVGGGFALGARMSRPTAEVWIIYGDGASGWSLVEFDTYVRMRAPVIAVIGNDACWSQMFRDQVRLLSDTVATELSYTHYEQVAIGFGAEGILVTRNEDVAPALKKAKQLFREGKSVLVNCLISRSAFREGSISL